jgi:Zn-dependent alcohol dehydrogenase
VIAGCERIISVDREAFHWPCGRVCATDTIRAAEEVPAAIRDKTGGRGADYVFDTVGSPSTLTDALSAARKGGTVVVTGLSRIDAHASIPIFPFVMQEKRLIGSVCGSGQPVRDIGRLISLYQEGRLKLRELIVRTYPLEQINEALDALEASAGARGMIRF